LLLYQGKEHKANHLNFVVWGWRSYCLPLFTRPRHKAQWEHVVSSLQVCILSQFPIN